MPILYVLRHAKSDWGDADLDDFDRPLAPRGRDACRKIAASFAAHGVAPEVVLCSPAVRAVETLEGVRSGLPSETQVRIEDDLYGASAPQVIERLQAIDEPGSIMVIGHNPAMEDLVLALASAGDALDDVRRKFPTAALATLELTVDWKGLAPGTTRLVDFVRPKDL